MEDLTPQERFDQLLAFLEDPDKHSYTRTGHNRRFPIDSITFPSLDLEDLVFLPGRRHRAGLVNDFRQEAIEVMLSDMFRDRLLRGNQKTGDIVIEQPEEFVLPVAAVIHTVRDYRAKSLSAFRSHTYDGELSPFDELRMAWNDLWPAFKKVVKVALKNRLIRPDRLVGFNPQKGAELLPQEKREIGGILGELLKIQAKCFEKVNKKEIKEMEKEIKRNFVMGGHKSYYLLKALQKVKIILVSTLPDYYAVNVFKLRTARAVNDAIQEASRIAGSDAKVWVIPHGNLTLPVMRQAVEVTA